MPLQRRAMAVLAVAAASALMTMPPGDAAADLQSSSGPHRAIAVVAMVSLPVR